MPPITLDGSLGITTPMYNGSITANAVTPSVNMKNRIINGAFQISQYNGTSATTPSSDVYVIDRFRPATSQASKLQWQQNKGSITPPAGFSTYLGASVASTATIGAGDLFGFVQIIEGSNCADLGWGTANAKTVTLSFQVYSSETGTFGGTVNSVAGSYSYPFSYTISSANTWTSISITIAGPTAGTWVTSTSGNIQVFWGFGVGSTYGSGTAGAWVASTVLAPTGAKNIMGTNGATFYITGVQLEVGSTATSFDYRPYTTELQLCQRYLPAFTGANGATTGAIGTGGFFSTTDAAIGIPFPVTARVAPTGITFASAGYFQIDGLTSAACTSATFSSTSQNMGGVNFGYATTTTSGSFARLRFNNALGTLLFTGCEL